MEPKSDFLWQSTNRTPPQYPMEMARTSLAGCAILSFNISDSGTTENVQVIKSVPNKDLGKHSRYMVKKWRWDAANNDSNPASEKRTLRMDYCIGGESAEESLQLCKQQTQLACG
ncbi:energy transducer TonB [Shewanella abyssi]|uniref:energy transducer TonB n=1 Tax=Shewanella abyssi TaxID=311789 RepID=UPI003D161EA7